MSETDSTPEPKQTLRSLSVTPQHFADLKSLEKNREFLTPEHPNLLKHYFRDIALIFEEFDKEFEREINAIKNTSLDNEVRLWRVSLDDGVKISVKTKPSKKPLKFDGNKISGSISVNVEQEIVPHDRHKQKCVFCCEYVDNLDSHLLFSCKAKRNS